MHACLGSHQRDAHRIGVFGSDHLFESESPFREFVAFKRRELALLFEVDVQWRPVSRREASHGSNLRRAESLPALLQLLGRER